MASKTALTGLVRQLDADAFLAGVDASPELLPHRDDRGRGWMHLACSVDAEAKGLAPERAVEIARGLLARGAEIDDPAFTEARGARRRSGTRSRAGEVGRSSGSSSARAPRPEHCLWAASFNEDLDLLAMLIEAGASLEAVAEDETPLFGAVKYGKFGAAEVLLRAGSDPDWRDSRGRTALHCMLAMRRPIETFELLVRHGARADIAGPDGRTVETSCAASATPRGTCWPMRSEHGADEKCGAEHGPPQKLDDHLHPQEAPDQPAAQHVVGISVSQLRASAAPVMAAHPGPTCRNTTTGTTTQATK